MPFRIDDPLVRSMILAMGFNPDAVNKIQPYDYALQWPFGGANSVAAGGQGQAQVNIDNGTPFVITEFGFSAYLLAADTSGGGNVAAFSQLVRDPGDTRLLTTSGALGNSMYSAAGLRLQLSDSYNQAWSQNPVRALNIVGRMENRAPMVQRVLPGGGTVQGTLFNDTAIAIGAELVMSGYRVYADAAR